MHRKRNVCLATFGLASIVLASCSSAEPSTPPPITSDAASHKANATVERPCTLSSKLVPDCGVLWGVATRPPTTVGLEAAEKLVRRKFDIVYRYHDVDYAAADDAEKAAVRAGTILHISVAARHFSSDSRPVTWADVASGKFDTSLRAQAQSIAELKVPVFVTFEQEASQSKKFGRLGTGTDFRAAWRHLHSLYESAGATNAVWVWVMTGAETNLSNAAQLWPGNDVVDWISWNVYNQSGCSGDRISISKYVSFKDKMLVFYNWVHQQGPKIGIDVSKPMMISETGTAQYPNDPQKSADWYADIPQVLQEYPQIKALQLWNSKNGACDYRFTNNPVILAGAAAAGLSQWVNQLGSLTPSR